MSFDLSKLSMIVVDDNGPMLLLLRSVLLAMEIRDIRTLRSAQAAYGEFVGRPPDIVVTDWSMKPMDGVDLTRMIRNASDSPNPYVPIIMLTSFSQFRQVRKARDAGVTEYLIKPVTTHGICSRLTAVIEQPRPFVRTGDFFGPDRRRRVDPNYRGPERRSGKELAEFVELTGEAARGRRGGGVADASTFRQ